MKKPHRKQPTEKPSTEETNQQACARLCEQLLSSTSYPHSVSNLQLRETHISWVFLTGSYAYKVKKPVNLGFVDFSTVERRRHFCEVELSRNQQYSSGLYLDVVPISGDLQHLMVDGKGLPIEYAVKMKQFDESKIARNLLVSGELSSQEMSVLAGEVGRVHQSSQRLGESSDHRCGTLEQIRQSALENISVLRSQANQPEQFRQLGLVEQWTQQRLSALCEVFAERRKLGFIRECHGDLHLGNLVRWKGRLTPFDCIEFNPDFYWIDVISEVAFLVMDLEDHQRTDLGWRFLNDYLEHSGDYSGLRLLHFYLVYRAMVRAKVSRLRMEQQSAGDSERQQLCDQWQGYLQMACRFQRPSGLSLTITHGVSGSGKTRGTQTLVEKLGAIRIRSDIERKRSAGLSATERPLPSLSAELYTAVSGQRTYDRLEGLAEVIIDAGFPVVVDATFLKRSQRNRFLQLAQRLGIPFRISEYYADPACLRHRLKQRMEEGADASDANEEVLEMQLRQQEPLDDSEKLFLD